MKCCQVLKVGNKCTEEASLEGKEVRNIIVITFAFQVVYTAFDALRNLHSSLHDEDSLGTISLAVMSATATVSSILAPTIIGQIGAKITIVAYFAAHSLYVLANFYPSFATMAPAAVVVGAFQGPAWTSQALYISASSYSFSKSSTASPYSILSRFNGFFFSVYATSQIVGNLVTSTVIRDGVSNDTDVTMADFRYCGANDCPASENATEIEDPESVAVQIILGFFLACDLVGLALVLLLLAPLPRSEWIQRVSVRSTATSCFQVLLSSNMVLLVPFIFFTAAEHAFLLSEFTKSYVACPLGLYMVGYVMAVYGATTPVFVFFLSRLARVAGRFLMLVMSLCVHIVLLVVMYHWSPTPDDEALIFILPIFWGVAQTVLQAQANALIAMLYPSHKEPAFANFHAFRSLGYAITFLNASYMCVSTKLLVLVTFASSGLVLYVFVELRTKVKERQEVHRPRDSIISLDSVVAEVEMRPEDNKRTSSLSRASVSSLQSVQDRLSFDRIELADIIMEAEQNWTRNEEGLTLEVDKAMSPEHLAGSKVTNLVRTLPNLGADVINLASRAPPRRPGLPRSLSDGHLHIAAVKVDHELNRINRVKEGRSHTLGTPYRRNNTPVALPKRRHISDINPPNLDVIREMLEEEAELAREAETDIDFYDFDEVPGDEEDSVFESQDDGPFRELENSKDLIRHLGKHLSKNSFALRDETSEDADNESVDEASVLSSTTSPDSISNSGSEKNYTLTDRTIVFTIGNSVTLTESYSNEAFESDDNDNAVYANISKVTNPVTVPKRSISLDESRLNDQHVADRKKFARSNSNVNQEHASNSIRKEKRTRKISVFKGFSKHSKKLASGDTNNGNIVSNTNTFNGKQEADSDADSDGFVNCEFDDNQNYLPSVVVDHRRPKRRRKVPVSEIEDVTSIY